MHLASAQLAATAVIRAVQGSRTIHHQQSVATLRKHGRRLNQQLGLVVGVVGASVSNVVQHVRGIQTEPEQHRATDTAAKRE